VDRGREARFDASGPRARPSPCPPRRGFFSLGGLLAPCARTPGSLAPWILSAAVLVALASWDPIARSGHFDVTLLGLAAYELLIGLTLPGGREPARAPARARAE
jgi:hypothetical protein